MEEHMSLHVSQEELSKKMTSQVISFNPVTREWQTQQSSVASSVKLPDFEGVLILTHSSDKVEDRPKVLAILYPKSTEDIALMLRFAKQHNLTVSSRGNMSQVPEHLYQNNSILIQMNTLSTIHPAQPDYIDVDAGVYWKDLLQETLKIKRTPPVLTDYTNLTVGGTLSIGGIGGTSYRYGVQIDNVLELEVVTGEGKIVVCSPRQKPDLFFAMLAGQGQCGIITRARIRLIEAPQYVRTFFLQYRDIDEFNNDQISLIHNERFQFVEGSIKRNDQQQALYEIVVAGFYNNPKQAPTVDDLGGLHFEPSSMQSHDGTYLRFLNRFSSQLGPKKGQASWNASLLWYEVFIPASQIHRYIEEWLASFQVRGSATTHMHIYPVKTSRFRMPFFRVPNEAIVFACHIMSSSPSLNDAQALLEDKRLLFEQVRELGGTHYSSNAIPLSPQEWRDHFGPVWPLLSAAKQRYDPHFLLSPEQNIFR
jgi:cytokinin dehydrogenase